MAATPADLPHLRDRVLTHDEQIEWLEKVLTDVRVDCAETRADVVNLAKLVKNDATHQRERHNSVIASLCDVKAAIAKVEATQTKHDDRTWKVVSGILLALVGALAGGVPEWLRALLLGE